MVTALDPLQEQTSLCPHCSWHYRENCLHPRGKKGACPFAKTNARSEQPVATGGGRLSHAGGRSASRVREPVPFLG
jgi:hypothetical protein